MTNVATGGERGLSGAFSWDNNEVHRKFYLAAPSMQLLPLLQKLFGESPGDDPHELPDDWGLSGFFAWSCNFEPLNQFSTQGDTNSDTVDDVLGLLDSMPTVMGGIVVDITYRPMDNSGNFMVNDEAWDFSAQTMSLIGNNFGQSPQSLVWSDGTAITNLTAIVKILPKIEILQKQLYVADLPTAVQVGLIGSVNDGAIFCGAAGGGAKVQWDEATLLLVGLPSIRRWRFDGQQIFEVGVKLAANTYQDFTETSPDFPADVTWQRLYRPEKGYWDTVLVGPDEANIYPANDLSQVIA